LRCSYSVATYEEQMRVLALNEDREDALQEKQPNIIGKYIVNSKFESSYFQCFVLISYYYFILDDLVED
jgi:hypothetical protein